MVYYYCVVPITILTFLVIISNLIMIKHIYKTNIASHGPSFMFRYMGMCNVSFGIFGFIHSIVQRVSAPLPIRWFTSTATVVSSFLHLGVNVSLAFERLQVIKHPMQYISEGAKKKLEKKLLLIVITSSLIIGFSCSTLRYIFSNVLIQSIPVAASRIIAYITLCVLYVKL